jgi:hypothetical protein
MGSNRTYGVSKAADQSRTYYFDPRVLRNRKRLAGIFFTLAMLSHCVSFTLLYLAITQKISYYLGVMIFLPVWIVGYWFGTFFSQVLDMKLPDGTKKTIISKKTKKILNSIVFYMGILLVAVWAYFYVTHILMVEKNTQLTNN